MCAFLAGAFPMNFIPDTVVLVQFAIASVILAITPGPDMTLFVSRTLSQGRAAGFASMAGALTGTLVHTTLVVVGEEDAITPPADSGLIHDRVHGSRLVEIEGAGHVSNLENPDAFNDALYDFLQELTVIL